MTTHTTRTMVLAGLAVATLVTGIAAAEARSGHGGRGFGGGRGIAVGERHPGGFGGHRGGFHRHHGFYGHGWGYPAGGYFMSSYGGFGCEVVFSHFYQRFVKVCR